MRIHGEVANPGTFVYTDNTTIEDLIIKAGGLLDAASSVKADITRRIRNPKTQTFVNTNLGVKLSFQARMNQER